MTKTILFASRKGGTGKSTLCAMVANHLAKNGTKVAVIDCDNCATLSWRRKTDMKNLKEGETPSYPIFLEEDYYGKENKFGDYDYVLIDNYNPNRELSASVIVVPFIYTEMVLESTFRFVKNTINSSNTEIVFLPNEVNGFKQSIKKKDILEHINWILGIFGKILPKVSNSRLMDQVNTIQNTVEVNVLIKEFVNELFPECMMNEEELIEKETSQPDTQSSNDDDFKIKDNDNI